MALVGEAKALLDARLDLQPGGHNVGFNAGSAAGQTVPHVHVYAIPRYAGDMGDPRGGVRDVIPGKGNCLAGLSADGAGDPRLSLTTGADRPLRPRLADRRPGTREIGLLASFVQHSGLDVIHAGLFSAIAAGARVCLLAGDYVGIPSPKALQQLLSGRTSPVGHSRPGSPNSKSLAACAIRFTQWPGGSRIRRAGSWSWDRAICRGRP